LNILGARRSQGAGSLSFRVTTNVWRVRRADLAAPASKIRPFAAPRVPTRQTARGRLAASRPNATLNNDAARPGAGFARMPLVMRATRSDFPRRVNGGSPSQAPNVGRAGSPCRVCGRWAMRYASRIATRPRKLNPLPTKRAPMPYRTSEDLPGSVSRRLPPHAQGRLTMHSRLTPEIRARNKPRSVLADRTDRRQALLRENQQ
jgi:hypothetical protein